MWRSLPPAPRPCGLQVMNAGPQSLLPGLGCDMQPAPAVVGAAGEVSCERRREQHSALCLLSRVNANALGLPDLAGIAGTRMFLPGSP